MGSRRRRRRRDGARAPVRRPIPLHRDVVDAGGATSSAGSLGVQPAPRRRRWLPPWAWGVLGSAFVHGALVLLLRADRPPATAAEETPIRITLVDGPVDSRRAETGADASEASVPEPVESPEVASAALAQRRRPERPADRLNEARRPPDEPAPSEPAAVNRADVEPEPIVVRDSDADPSEAPDDAEVRAAGESTQDRSRAEVGVSPAVAAGILAPGTPGATAGGTAPPAVVPPRRRNLLGLSRPRPRSPVPGLDLRPTAGGGYRYQEATFSAEIAADGTVTLSDRGTGVSSGGQPLAGGGASAGVGVNVDLTEVVMRAVGDDPYLHRKMTFMEQTAALRAEMSRTACQQRLELALVGLKRDLEGIWSDGSLSAERRRRLLFQLWDDCADTGDETMVGYAEQARAVIVAFIVDRLPEGSDLAFTPAELDRFNLRRRSLSRFDPYGAGID